MRRQEAGAICGRTLGKTLTQQRGDASDVVNVKLCVAIFMAGIRGTRQDGTSFNIQSRRLEMFSNQTQSLKAMDPDPWAVIRQAPHIELTASDHDASPAREMAALTQRFPVCG
jgi:hypothetical protein